MTNYLFHLVYGGAIMNAPRTALAVAWVGSSLADPYPRKPLKGRLAPFSESAVQEERGPAAGPALLPGRYGSAMSDVLRGQLLVAAPILTDPNFHRTVVFVAEHGEEGAMGLVPNRPTETSVGDAVPEPRQIAGEEQPLFVGGPVSTGRARRRRAR